MTGRGGKRENAGRPPGPTASASQKLLEAKARKEHALADLRTMEAAARARELIPSVEVEEVVGVAFNRVAQMLLGLPDLLERAAGLTPEAAEVVERVVHASMNGLADDLAAIADVSKPAE
jgi:hypothetical protein